MRQVTFDNDTLAIGKVLCPLQTYVQRHATSCSLLPTLCRHHWSENPGLWTGLRLSKWQAACSTSNADLPKTWSDYTLAPLVSTCVPEVGAGLALHMLMWQLMDVMTQGCIMTVRRRLRCTSRARWRCCAVLGLCTHLNRMNRFDIHSAAATNSLALSLPRATTST